MSFLELCKQRFSVRAYSAEPVSESQLEYILECARLAPSAVNLQPWKFVVVQGDEARARVQSCYKREWIAQAPVYIICVVCHDEEWVRGDGKHHGNIDVAIAAEHICLAATEQGLGSCWVCNFDARRLHDLLGLRESEEAAVIVPLGHPADGLEEPLKKRKGLGDIVSRL
ncbi:MAG TPA: nitroreductase [Prevotellaceae bacterium]|nr:nitroreductase [Prevotellaceae bacterium]HBE54529.1 nitroreductase [Prevotellaceae bacterium]